MADLSKIREALERHEIKEKREDNPENWFISHFLTVENQYQGKLVSDNNGNLVSSGWFYRIPLLIEGKIRSRHYRYYPNNPIEKFLIQAKEKGLIREGQLWKYDKRLLTKLMFVVQKVQNEEDRIKLQQPHLFYLRGTRANQQILTSIKNILSDSDVPESDLASIFDPYVASFRLILNYIPGREGSTTLTLSMAQYKPPQLPEQLKSFDLSTLGINTEDEWEPDPDEYLEAVERFEAALESDSARVEDSQKTKPTAPTSKARTKLNSDIADKNGKSNPAGTVIKDGFTYELTEQGVPTCFTQANTSDPRCLKCDFLAECLAS